MIAPANSFGAMWCVVFGFWPLCHTHILALMIVDAVFKTHEDTLNLSLLSAMIKYIQFLQFAT
jgi:hypothetical protein